MGNDESILAIISDDDLDQTGEHDIEVVGGISFTVEILPDLDAPASAEGCQSDKLRRVEGRDQLLVNHRDASDWRRICRFLMGRGSTQVQVSPGRRGQRR